VLRTSVGDFCGYLEQIVVPDVSVSFRHFVWSQLSATAFLVVGGLLEKGSWRTMAQSASFGVGTRK
jgi:hypothetical protein